MPDGTTQSCVITPQGQLIVIDSSWECVQTAEQSLPSLANVSLSDAEIVETTVESQTELRSLLATLIAKVDVMTEENRKMHAEYRSNTKKVDEMYSIIAPGMKIRAAPLNKKTATDDDDDKFTFAPIKTIDDAIKLEENLGKEDGYEESLVCISRKTGNSQ